MSRAFKPLNRIICGISGGVDSAVAALILKKKGYEVEGLFMKNWDKADETGKCTVEADYEDAEMICKTLDIKLHRVNFVKEYWNDVFSEMVRGYEKGITPNPDILCNKHIKFDAFFHHAVENLGAEAIATGHYARTSANYFVTTDFPPEDGVKLLKAVDTMKDQTFFLSQISQKALQKTIFPLGDLTKPFVKRIAIEAGLEKIARKKESMGMCFIGSRQFQHFIDNYILPFPGNFIDVKTGKIVGEHKGLHQWTVGQRANIPGLKEAYFIAEKNLKTNDILVAPGTNHPALFYQTVFTSPPHWIHLPPPDLHQEMASMDFRFQHKHPLVSCTLFPRIDKSLIVSVSQPMRAMTAGQYAVFYRGEECLGSAQIERTGSSLYKLVHGDRVNNSKEFS